MIEALILGIVQGLTEFLPISSSAHLIVVSSWLQSSVLPLPLNVGLHMGTLVAIFIYFWRDWLDIAKDALNGRFHLLICLIISSIPAAVMGLLFKEFIESAFHRPEMTIAPLALAGILLWQVDAKQRAHRSMASIGFADAFVLGCCQALALIPGVSRSGITITGARFMRLSRPAAARYSFLMGGPVMLGAAILEHREIALAFEEPSFFVGFLSAAITGALAIHLLLGFIKRYSFFPFAIYRLALAALLFVMFVVV